MVKMGRVRKNRYKKYSVQTNEFTAMRVVRDGLAFSFCMGGMIAMLFGFGSILNAF